MTLVALGRTLKNKGRPADRTGVEMWRAGGADLSTPDSSVYYASVCVGVHCTVSVFRLIFVYNCVFVCVGFFAQKLDRERYTRVP